MNRVVISALIGIAVAAAALAAPRFGYPIPLPTLMAAAAALSLGAAAAVLARLTLDTTPKKTKDIFAGTQIKRAASIYTPFPAEGDGATSIVLRPDSRVDTLDIVRHPERYKNKEIMVTLRGSESGSFNPSELRKLFTALAKLNFRHLLLRNAHNEYVGYIPGLTACEKFTTGDAEYQIARYIVNVFADPSNSAYLHDLRGASQFDWIDDEKSVADAVARMAGGFSCLVVLDDSNRRKPLGVMTYESLMGQSLQAAAKGTSISFGGTIGDFRPTK